MSPFHSNCGGKTSPAGMVWQRDLPYLQAVEDPFCKNGKNATWHATITKESWLGFITDYTRNNIDYSRYNFSFDTPTRTKFISIHGIDLNLRTVREHFNLRSAYFNIKDDGESLKFNGKGYGHGVGMCQWGAFNMASQGWKSEDILLYYYPGSEIIRIE